MYSSSHISYMDLQDPSKSDPGFDTFNAMMKPFEDKHSQIFNDQKYISDSILHDAHDKYLVHYEEYNGTLYPIITILKGTLLFNARKHLAPTIHESFFHLYKLSDTDSLSKYVADDCEKSLTYFYPVPYMAPVLGDEYKMMDMVVLSKDIRLLCLISPSPISRSIKDIQEKMKIKDISGNPYYIHGYNDSLVPLAYMEQCNSREYDICLSNELISRFELNGYIGIAYMDSLSKPQNLTKLKYALGLQNTDIRKSLLYLSSCFNNEIYSERGDPLGDRFIDKMIDNRTYGIPEIVLIPYDLHRFPKEEEYVSVYNEFLKKIESDPYDIELAYEDHFIFKPVETVIGVNTQDVAKNMGIIIGDPYYQDIIKKSLQCYPLLNVLKDEIDLDKQDYIVDYNDPTRPIRLDDVAFPYSYMDPPRSKCAFETVQFYEMLPGGMAGGFVDQTTQTPYSNLILPSPSKLQWKSPSYTNKPSSNYSKKTTKMNKEKEQASNVYYKEVNGIPIFAFIQDQDNNKSGGRKMTHTSKRSKKHRSNKKKRTLRYKNKDITNK